MPKAPQKYNPNSKYPTTKTTNGGVIENRGNHQVHYRADGSREKVVAGNKTTVYRADGSRAQVVRGNTRTDYGKGGAQTVYRGGVRQYNQNRVVVNNTTVIQRTYYSGGSSYVRTYNPYYWGGRSYYAYTPAIVFAPSFYGYCYTPWYTPVVYSWGWNSSPWYGYYGYYYRPYPRYTSPAYWLTDYLISDMLATQYQDNYAAAQTAQANAQAAQANERTAEANERAAEANERAAEANAQAAQAEANAHAASPITDEVKEQIKAQVEEAIKANEQKTPIQIGSLMSDTKHVYAVSDDLDVTTAEAGTECTLTSGDLIRLSDVPNDGDQAAQMMVISAKKESCAAGSKIMVSMTDLQSFQNDFAERVETGMGKMKTEMPQK
ncbi:MAG: hypothetical protein HY074_11335 [Deltaproteobacteria bacterium]|nr:hypothetical protein [Deltaproteobacteria bacterium]